MLRDDMQTMLRGIHATPPPPIAITRRHQHLRPSRVDKRDVDGKEYLPPFSRCGVMRTLSRRPYRRV